MPILLRATLLAAAGLLAGTPADDAADARKILQLSGLRGGLCLHLGCGRADSAGLTAALAEGGS